MIDVNSKILDEKEANNVLSKVYTRMFFGIMVTALVAAISSRSESFLYFSQSGFLFLAIAEIAVSLIFSFCFMKLSSTAVTILFYIYAVLTGLSFSSIFIAFDLNSVFGLFLVTALIFGIMAILGRTSKANLSNLGSILFASLIAGLVLTFINLFMRNSFVDIVVDWIMLAIFMGYTAYDVQNISNLLSYSGIDEEHLYTYGAMQLYLDFINIFIRLLSIFGRRRDS